MRRTVLSLLSITRGLNAVAVKRDATSQDEIIALNQTEVQEHLQYVQLARVNYCSIELVSNWRCGEACNAVPDFKWVFTGGNDKDIPRYTIGYWPSRNAVTVIHKGMSLNSLSSLEIMAEAEKEPLSKKIFPDVATIAPGTKVHDGISDAHTRSANVVLHHVGETILKYKATQVIAIGYSMGGSIALLDGLYLRQQLPSDIGVQVIGIGAPRMGNQAFVNYVDSVLPGSRNIRIINGHDQVPRLPPSKWPIGFHSVGLEVHVHGGEWFRCIGSDNKDPRCTSGQGLQSLRSTMNDHLTVGGIPMTLVCATDDTSDDNDQ